MAGTLAGGKAAAATNVKKYGKDFYKKIGAKGGKNSHTGGFASDSELASRAGKIGGSRRWADTDIRRVAQRLRNDEY